MDGNGNSEGGIRVLKLEVVAGSGAAHTKGSQQEAGKGFQEQVERGVERSSDSTQVEIEVSGSDPTGSMNQGASVCRL